MFRSLVIKLCALFLMLLMVTTALADSSKLSPALRMFAKTDGTKSNISNQLFNVYEHPLTGETTVNVLMKLNSAAIIPQLENLGVEINTILPSGIVTAHVPVVVLETIASYPEVNYVDISAKQRPLMNFSRLEIGIDNVHSGQGLPQAFKGENVIVGVIDSGIDFDHSDFKNPDGSTRCAFIWDQCATTGTPPTDYTYGNECSAAEINAGACSEGDSHVGSGGHGTHVAGTAAGDGSAPNSTGNYTGIAPKADIIFVNSGCPGGFEDAWVVDATNYIFAKAQALGQPAVINMSLGGHYTPHDGTSLYEQALTELTGPGRIIVAAAGNEGADYIHIGHEVNYAGASAYFAPTGSTQRVIFDIWYDDSYQMDVLIKMLDPISGAILGETDWVTPGNSFEGTFSNGIQVGIDATEVVNPQNGDRQIVMLASGVGVDQFIWETGFSAHNQGQTAQFDCWELTGSGRFLTGYTDINGDNLKSIGTPATADSLIAVAAYNTKNQWTDREGNLQDYTGDVEIGDKADFSSIGPRRDGGLKPEIAAPGQFIVSTLTADIPIGDGGIPSSNVIYGGYYQKMQGTSMACPHITGVVALMLQRNPTLDYGDVMEIFASTARSDAFTEAYTPYIGPLPNIVWGHGKVNGYAAVAAVQGGGEPQPVYTDDFESYTNFALQFSPWTLVDVDGRPTYGITNVSFPNSGSAMAYIIFNPSATTPAMTNPAAAAHSGQKYAACIAAQPTPNNNDWMITRSIQLGTSSSVSFWAKSYTNQYGLEHFKVGVSTTGTNPGNFNFISPDPYVDAPIDWTQFNYDLSQYNGQTVYIGINCVSDDAFIFMVDDFVVMSAGGTGIEDDPSTDVLPTRTVLNQNYPNPFNPTTVISFQLPVASEISLKIYNMTGQLVKTLATGNWQPGTHKVTWDGTNEQGASVGSGVYHYQLQTNSGQTEVKRMILLK